MHNCPPGHPPDPDSIGKNAPICNSLSGVITLFDKFGIKYWQINRKIKINIFILIIKNWN